MTLPVLIGFYNERAAAKTISLPLRKEKQMEEKRINDDVELYLASNEPVEADNEPATEEPTVEPISAKKDAPKAIRVGEVPEFRERNKKSLNYFPFSWQENFNIQFYIL